MVLLRPLILACIGCSALSFAVACGGSSDSTYHIPADSEFRPFVPPEDDELAPSEDGSAEDWSIDADDQEADDQDPGDQGTGDAAAPPAAPPDPAADDPAAPSSP